MLVALRVDGNFAIGEQNRHFVEYVVVAQLSEPLICRLDASLVGGDLSLRLGHLLGLLSQGLLLLLRASCLLLLQLLLTLLYLLLGRLQSSLDTLRLLQLVAFELD